MFLFFACLAVSRPDYVTSKFGKEGIDDVLIEYHDGFEVLERNLPKQETKSIALLNLTEYIPDSDYAWPGHNLKCNWTSALKETREIKKLYSNSNIKDNMRYRHPVGPQQFYTTYEALDKAERVKVRLTLTPKYNRHFGRVFMPPGEIVTITMLPGGVNKADVTYNKYMSPIWTLENGKPKYSQRLDDPRFDNIKLNKTVNKLCCPYGAILTFDIRSGDPVEINISGVILCPFFKYGVTTDKEWEDYESKLPGPVACFDSGVALYTAPSKFVRGSIRINDCMKFWRSAYLTSQTAASDGYNSRDGRPLNILEMNFETFVPAGAAVAFVGRNFCHLPPDWINDIIKWDSLQNDPWGTAHEMDHHHQSGWADGGVDEMSNNALNLLIYAKTNQASARRTDKGGLGGWPSYASTYQPLNVHDKGYPLAMYATWIQYFGVNKMKDYINSDQDNTLYNRNDVRIGRRGAQMLRTSKIFGKDMHRDFNFHFYDDVRLENNRSDSIVWDLLKELKLEPFHPVTNAYASGFIGDDGIEFESTRPFQIYPVEQEFDFVRTMRQRENKEWFGDFVFDSIITEEGRKSAWKPAGSLGKYRMTPTENQTHLEKVIVRYKDLSNKNKLTNVIVKLKQIGNIAFYKRISNVGNDNDVIEAYNKSLLLPVTEEKIVKKVESPLVSTDITGWISITRGKITVPQTKEYNFTMKTDDRGLFYLSEEELKGNPDDDKDYLIVQQDKYIYDYTKANKSLPILLDESKQYNFIFVVQNKVGASGGAAQGQGVVGYQTGPNKFTDIPNGWLRGLNATDKEVWDSQYEPNFTVLYGMDKWDGINFIRELDVKGWDVYKKPPGEPIINSNNGEGKVDKSKTATELLTDGKENTEWRTYWWIGNIPNFPHVYEMDLGREREIRNLKIGCSANQNYYRVDSDVEIRLATGNFSIKTKNGTIPYNETNSSLQHVESLVYTGTINKTYQYALLNETKKGRYLRVTILNNRAKWKDGHPGRSAISSIDIGTPVFIKKVRPITNTKLISSMKGFDTVSDGIYYNGRGKKGGAGASVTVKIPGKWKEIGIIGDLYPTMGSATIKIDNKIVGTIDKSLINDLDRDRLKMASRSYKQLLFMTNLVPSDNPKTMTINVDSGEVILAGILADEKLDGPGVKEEDYGFTDDTDSQVDVNPKHGNSNSATIAGIVIGAIACLALAMFIGVIGVRYEWWCKPPEDSDVDVRENFTI